MNLSSCVICFHDNVPHECLGPCAHLLHRACVEKMVKMDCPLCRTPLFTRVSKKPPPPPVSDRVIERGFDDDTSLDTWREQGYLYKSEHPDYDTENPDSDCDYPDEENGSDNEYCNRPQYIVDWENDPIIDYDDV